MTAEPNSPLPDPRTDPRRDKLAQVRQQHAALGKIVRQLEGKAGPRDERESQRELMAGKRAAGRDIAIAPVADPARRAAALADVFLFLTTYFPDAYFNPFTADQREMILDILHCARHGGDVAIGAPRGDGKTTSALRVLIFALLTGLVGFGLVIAATDDEALARLNGVKYEFESNDLLAADFPEICGPIRALEGSPGRARLQTVGGRRTLINWSAKFMVLPTIEDSPASGAILLARGITASFRGLNYRNRRPDFVLADDIETRESAASPYQVQIREQTLDCDVAGLAGPTRKIARVVLCTLQNRRCLAARVTDRKIKPAFRGRRYRQLVAWPEREDLWEEYCAMRRRGQEIGADSDGREANAFYLLHRTAMDAGAVLSNPYRFDATPHADGSPTETSALQACYNFIADKGLEAFQTEKQNDPQEEEGPETSGLTASLIEERVNGWPQGRLPPDVAALVAAIDVGKYACHWTAIAWLPRCVGLVIDHGVLEVYGTTRQQDGPTVDAAILSALHRWREEQLAAPYRDAAGQARTFDLVLVDSGDYSQAIYQFVRDVGGLPFVASKGSGGGRFHAGVEAKDRRVFEHCFIKRQPEAGIWLYHLDTDYWKHFVHARFLTPTFDESKQLRPGSLSLFSSPQPRWHLRFAKHIVAEEWRKEWIEGKGEKAGWVAVSKNNHWLDSTYMACAAGDLCGVKLLSEPTRIRETPPDPRSIDTLRSNNRFENPYGQPYLLTDRNR